MDYEKYILDGFEIAKQKVKEAQNTVCMIEFSHKVYGVILSISDNPKFAYQVARDFSFDRILKSKEFNEDEKAQVQVLAAYYKSNQ